MIYQKKLVVLAVFVGLVLLAVAIAFRSAQLDHSRNIQSAKKESMAIAHFIFITYFGDPEIVRGLIDEKDINHRIFSLGVSQGETLGLGRDIARPDKTDWREKELLIDPWGEPYWIEVSEDANTFRVIVRSGGPDRRLGTSDDVQYIDESEALSF